MVYPSADNGSGIWQMRDVYAARMGDNWPARGIAPSWLAKADSTAALIHIDFANGRYYFGGKTYRAHADILAVIAGTFARSSIAYRNDASGMPGSVASGVARLDYDLTTLAPKGLLIEGSRTNYILHSQELENAVWSRFFTTISANATTAPDGAASADLVIPNASNNYHGIGSLVASTSGAQAYSCYVKAGGYAKVAFRNGDTGDYTAFSLSGSGSIIASSGLANATIKALPNGWYRISVLVASGVSSYQIFIPAAGYTSGNVLSSTFAGDGVSGVYVWGVQGEAATFPSSYIPTTSTSATRPADVLQIGPSGGLPFVGFARPFGVYFKGSSMYPTSNGLTNEGLISFTNGGTNRTYVDRINGTPRIIQSNAGDFSAVVVLGSMSPGVDYKVAARFETNNVNGVVNGVLGTSDTSSINPDVDRLFIGDITGSGANPHFGWISEIAVFGFAPSDAAMQGLTT